MTVTVVYIGTFASFIYNPDEARFIMFIIVPFFLGGILVTGTIIEELYKKISFVGIPKTVLLVILYLIGGLLSGGILAYFLAAISFLFIVPAIFILTHLIDFFLSKFNTKEAIIEKLSYTSLWALIAIAILLILFF